MVPEEEPSTVGGDAKLMAAMMAVFILLFGIVAITLVSAIIIGLWHAGIVEATVIIGLSTIALVIIRKLYRYILEKDFL